jgi:ectoine hydroxylase-related dioxygenase (phytanoyl-CoA dioxygenase family)
MRLSQEEIGFFRQVGFLRLKQRLSTELVQQMREVIEAHSAAEIEPLRRDENNKIIRLDNVLDRDPIFRSVFTSETILQPLQSLLGPNIELVLNRHNHATFNRTRENKVRLHRDVLQWSRSVITVFVYLDAATEENGCTQVVPGSHFLPFVGTPNNGGTWMDEHSVFADLIDQCVPVPMPSGGILFLDSLVFHTAGHNSTEKPRCSVCCAYHSVDELSGVRADPKKILVCGEKLYRGNDELYRE